MSGVLLGVKPRHPEGKSLKDALAEDAPRLKAQKGIINKRATLIKASADGEPDAGTGATMRPTDEQLAAINGFTRKKVTADEVVAFTTLSCNDLVDRDDDQFTTQCVKDFAALEQPFSPTGKSYMMDHAYSVNNAIGRIFGTDTKKVNGGLFLTNDVYIPNTEKNQGFIEDIDFGINWAVSVGVMLGKSSCTVCGSKFSSYGYWCYEGHDKGLYYDPNSEETDSWGYPAPVDPKTKGAIKCIRQFSDPTDMYELSQVFLGAQYFAALEKEPEFAAVMKSATKDIPIIGLSAKEAEVIPLRHEPEKVSEARKSFAVTEDEEGLLVWTDDQGLRWTFDPEAPDEGVMSLGRSASTDNEGENEDGEHAIPGSSGGNEGVEVSGLDPAVTDPEAGNGGSGSGSDQGDSELDKQGGDADESASGLPVTVGADDEDEDEEDSDSDEDDEDSEDDSEDEEEDTDDDDDSEDDADKSALLASARKAKLPKSVIKAVKEATGDPLSALLSAAGSKFAALTKEANGLKEKAAIGETFLVELRADAIAAYVRNNATKEAPRVNTDLFERLLDRCGTDVDLLKDLTEKEMSEARKKFPKSVRRSTMQSDPNEPEKLEKASIGEFDEVDADNDKRVSRLHS